MCLLSICTGRVTGGGVKGKQGEQISIRSNATGKILNISLTHYQVDKKCIDREAKTLMVSFQLEAKEYPSTELISQSKFHTRQINSLEANTLLDDLESRQCIKNK